MIGLLKIQTSFPIETNSLNDFPVYDGWIPFSKFSSVNRFLGGGSPSSALTIRSVRMRISSARLNLGISDDSVGMDASDTNLSNG